MKHGLALSISLSSLSVLLALALWASSGSATTPVIKAPTFSNRVILIRHGEKGRQDPLPGTETEPERESRWGPPWGPGRGGKGKFPSGLNDKGRQRAQHLRTFFGKDSGYDIGLIFAAPRELPKETERTYATVAPLAQDLGLEIDIDCADADADCIVSKVEAFAQKSSADILISWKHRDLNVIATALGAKNARKHYPDERYDIVWTMQDGAIVHKQSMHCPVLDDNRVDEDDPDLEIEPLTGSRSTWDWIARWGGWRDVWRAQRTMITHST
ncbi:hypothetical protein PUNSTDRAFT_146386 [Punctularia strigosozonata HHB-11173 SS5]|uniref:Phosphoglycerate mutase-like protein n=1 Tax=Punctularia strigosozonata (strain HHB-11173) TaxID=741275 RepID=R7S321_PUNST|nr:uncharacterized protein PUNSTDRAFT_146386 [Punctularia strigosozonata HHB-11173 SS5]EIN04775.1 hypothetical protein PUNSTDRAFT_146386 [Punctularia strigosozonata HHB-11173 SS5]